MTTDRVPDEMRLHHYWPSYLHMGDCAVCGNVERHPMHFPSQPLPPHPGTQYRLELDAKK